MDWTPKPRGGAGMKIHELKTISPFFELVRAGKKNFELRKNDRDFAVGDQLWLRHWDADAEMYLGSGVYKAVTYITDFKDGLRDGWVCLGLDTPDALSDLKRISEAYNSERLLAEENGKAFRESKSEIGRLKAEIESLKKGRI